MGLAHPKIACGFEPGARAGSPCCGRRAGILLAVLVVVSLAALAGTSATFVARSELETASVSLRRVQSRALAWSGVQAAMSELAQQRDGIMLGERPTLTGEWELFEETSGRRAVVRLVPAQSGEPAVSEQAKLDINTATEEMLAALGLDEPLIAALTEARKRRAFGSAAELLQVGGFTPEILFGEAWGESGTVGGAAFERTRDGDAAIGERASTRLIDKLTVFSFDPNVQVGWGPGGAAHRGRLRINLNTPWSERLGSAIDDRFGAGAGAMARGLMASGTEIDSLAVLIEAARKAKADRRVWPMLLDAFTVSDDLYIRGRVDLNAAPAEVLACIPGISLEAAELIVQTRANITDEARRSILWPLEEEILSVDEIALAADHLTTRSLQWRIVVEGGFLRSGDRRSWRDLEGEELAERVVLEAVIDIASERPRVAYLREITMLPVALAMAATLEPVAAEDVDPLYPEQDDEWGLPQANAERPSLLDFVSGSGEWAGGAVPERSILEPSPEGPIEADAKEVGSPAGDQRIGRWTPGPARKGNGS